MLAHPGMSLVGHALCSHGLRSAFLAVARRTFPLSHPTRNPTPGRLLAKAKCMQLMRGNRCTWSTASRHFTQGNQPNSKGSIMKRTVVLAALLLVAASAFANDVDPFGFEKEHFQSSKSRGEVKAELEDAQAIGQLPVFGEIGVKPVEIASTKSRAQVVAETREAARLGLLGGYGELGPKRATVEQEQQIKFAGGRAIAPTTASK
jgi:hypothetical protein